jgi:hypothetical protein
MLVFLYVQTTSRRLADRKTAKFQKNITKRGSVPETTVKKGNDYPVGPIVLGFFIFVVIGSCMSSSLLLISYVQFTLLPLVIWFKMHTYIGFIYQSFLLLKRHLGVDYTSVILAT